jgi:methylmalonyl-CoA/ethylmalonyl-CoA epimerase
MLDHYAQISKTGKKIMDDFKFSHIGWAVLSIEKSIPIFSVLGYFPDGSVCNDIKRGVNLLLLRNGEGNTIELVEPVDDSSPVTNILNKTGPAPYHICLSCSQIVFEENKKNLLKNKFIELHKMDEAPALDGAKVAFFYSNTVGLIEIQLHE